MNSIETKKYNGCIEVWRYVMTFLVGMMHFYYSYYQETKVFEGFYVAVDFFFMLSGFYLFSTLSKTNELSAIKYSVKKYKGLFFILASSILIFDLLSFRSGLFSGMYSFVASIPDILCLQMTGIYYPSKNCILWYISAMMIAGFFIAALFRISRKITCNICLPLFIILGYSYIYLNNDNLDVTFLMNGKHIVPPGTIRAFAGMSIGGGIYLIYNNLQNTIKIPNAFICVIEVLAIILSFAIAFVVPHTSNDFLQLLLFPIIIICSLQQSSPCSLTLNKIGIKLIDVFGKQYTLALYCHSLVVPTLIFLFVSHKNLSVGFATVVFLFTWIVFSFAIVKLNDLYKSTLNNIKYGKKI